MKLFCTWCLIVTTSLSSAAVLRINARNSFATGGFAQTINNDGGTNPLPVGSLIEIGYFDGRVSAPTNAGDFASFTPVDIGTALAIGSGSGDTPGTFSTGDVTLDNVADTTLPSGTPTLFFGIRFYDGPDSGSSTNFVTVANPIWNGTFTNDAMSTEVVDFNLTSLNAGDNGNLVWDGGVPFQTTVPVPEPSSTLLCALSLIGLTARRRRG